MPRNDLNAMFLALIVLVFSKLTGGLSREVDNTPQ